MFLRTPLSLSLFSQLGEWWWWWWCVAMVLHEEPRAMCSNSNSGGGSRSSSKKSKQKKPPQRGMGVAQLEELRMREQQQQQHHKSTVVPSCGLILASARQPSLPFLASDINILCSRSGGDFLGHPPPLVESSSAGCSGSAESGLLPVLEPCPRDPEVVARRYSLHSSLQTSNSMQRWPHHHHQQQQQQQKFQMVYRTSSSSSSSGVTTLMEPPSNQSYSSNKYPLPPDCPEEERVVSMKRPWPFLPDCSTSHISLPYKMPAFDNPFLKPDEPLLTHGHRSNKYALKGAPFRGSNWSSSMNQIDCKRYCIQHDNRSSKENRVARDDNYLSLGPLEAPSFSRTNHTFSISDPTECPQRSLCEAKSQFGNSSQPPQFYNFLPMGPNSQEDNTKDRRAEASDAIDLNLKL